jgi:hypothetical protein
VDRAIFCKKIFMETVDEDECDNCMDCIKLDEEDEDADSCLWL